MKPISENPDQHNTLHSKMYSKIKSKSTLIYSSVQNANFIRHNYETNLNLPPLNWLKNEGESYGMRYKTGDLHDFSSFQMANMFPEYIGKVDIVSNVENIKNLIKMPYDKKSVSIIVHRIGNTLLLDEFDIEKHLINVTDEKWNWLKKYFYMNIVKSAHTKVKCITYKQNDLSSIQHNALVSKFLHHSIALDSHNDQIKNNDFHAATFPLSFPLPKMIPEEVFPNCAQKHQLLFNRNVLWCLEDFQMLIGTDLPVFENGNKSSLSPRLRDMSKPLSMLTGLDYWLDNIICDIPQIEFCHHLNGIVQKYEVVKTEDLPCLNDSTFSPNDISIYLKYILSILKSNAHYNGYTYWLFKGKNDNIMYVHDLTTFCSEPLIDNPNPFTVPVTSLLYHIACKLKHNPEDGKTYNPVTIIHLLNNCLKLLDKTKYPQAVTSINHILSDIYIAVYNNPLSNVIQDLSCLDKKHATTGLVFTGVASTHFDHGAYSVDVQNESISLKKENILQIPEYSTTQSIEKCLFNALYYIGCSLSCLQYFKNDRDIAVEPHFRRILFKKAADVYFNLGLKCYTSNNYGIALKCFRRSLECQLCVNNTSNFYSKLRLILEYCGNCFLSILSFYDKIEQYMSEIETDEFYDVELRKTLISNSKVFTNKDLNLILTRLDKSKESMLSAAEHCYLRALELGTDFEKKYSLNKRIGYVYSEYTSFYMSEIVSSIENNIPLTLVKLKWLKKKSEHYFTLGSDIFKKIEDKSNFVMLHTNLANHYRHIAEYLSKFPIDIKEFMKKENLYFEAVNIYMTILSELEDRSSDLKLWDMVYFELSKVQYYLSVQNYSALWEKNSKNYKECINSFIIALKYCDLENDTPNKFSYEYQAARINSDLGSLYSVCFKKSVEADSVLLQAKNYYNNSFELFYKIKCPLESLEVLVKMIILDMSFINSIISIWHVQHIKSIIKTLGKCDAVFLIFLENMDTFRCLLNTYQIEELTVEGKSNFKMRKLNLLKTLKENVCQLLKYMIKMAMNKTFNWLADKEDELKTIYRTLLKNTVVDNDCSQIMIAVKQLSRFSDN